MAGQNQNLVVITINAHRIGRREKILEFFEAIKPSEPNVIFIQEIAINMALKIFSPHFQIFVNLETPSNDGVGIVTLVDKRIKVIDHKIGEEGRTIGIKTREMQFWNVYPKSGTNNKNWREKYFREELSNHMIVWKDQTRYVIQGGDHNCTIRECDSENNQVQHYQKALVNHFRIHGMKDEYIRLHGNENPISFSRITRNSKTRIDLIASNCDQCLEFRYDDIGQGFDHKMGVARYDLDILNERNYIPFKKRYSSWAFPKELLADVTFRENAKSICDLVENETRDAEEFGNGEVSYPIFWKKLKDRLVRLAKIRHKQINEEENGRKNAINAYLQLAIEEIENGEDSWDEFTRLRAELNEVWKVKAKRMMDRSKVIEIEDHVYDIHKLQKQKKFENKSKIDKIKIKGVLYEGPEQVLEGIYKKMSEELKCEQGIPFNDEATEDELALLNKLPRLRITKEEEEDITGEITEQECEEVFKELVNLDSSPGIDGITYRAMWSLWNMSTSYKNIFMKHIKWTRENNSMGPYENVGVMKILNKKKLTDEYEGKRKLTLVNKDSNFIGKIWTNRFTKKILTKVLPKTQYNCQQDINIIDENGEIRDVVLHLRGEMDNGTEKDGTVLAIDFKNAFRSTYLRWYRLIMEYLGVPKQFRDWFWTMYDGLKVMIAINGMKSEKILVERGFMEGSPCSMACFVAGLIPLLIELEENLEGITTPDGVKHKVKAFADDDKVFLKNPDEIHKAYEIIEKFEHVSGLEMHRDPARQKCSALVFGNHRDYNNWPDWVTIKDEVKIVGIMYGNNPEKSLESLNSDMVRNSFNKKLFSSHGIRGTVQQKIAFATTYLLSKIWYVSQSIMLDEKMLKEIDKKVRDFIYAGENERPVQAVVYRPTEYGGLGLTCPMTKARAFILRNTMKVWKRRDENDKEYVIYGSTNDIETYLEQNIEPNSVKEAYLVLLNQKIVRGTSWIPSRAEKKNPGIKWKITWQNIKCVKQVSPIVKQFSWNCVQDMVVVGERKHRANQNKNCEIQMEDDAGNLEECGRLESLRHALCYCPASVTKFEWVEQVLTEFFGRKVEKDEVTFLSFNHRNKKKLKIGIWYTVNCLYYIYSNRSVEVGNMVENIKKQMFWHLTLERWISNRISFIELYGIVQKDRQ